MTAAPSAAGPAVGEEAGGQDEKPGFRIEVAGIARPERLGVGRQDLRPPRVLEGQPGRVRFGQRTLRHPCDGTA